MDSGSDRFLPGIFREHRLEIIVRPVSLLNSSRAYRESSRIDFFANPTTQSSFCEKFHVPMRQMRSMVRVENEETGLCSITCILHAFQGQFACFQHGVVLDGFEYLAHKKGSG